MKIKLRDISSLITKGTTPTSIGFNFESQGIKFVKVECFAPDGSFLPSKVVYISECCHEKLKRSQLKENDILFSIAGAIGRVAMVTREMLPCNTNQALAIIRISDKRVYLPYIKHVLSSSYISKQFNKLKQGVAQLNISLTDVGNLVIPLPKYAKQVDITHTLAKIQSIISHRLAQLAKLDELVKCRFIELFGDIKINPRGWNTETVDTITREIIGGVSLNGEHREMKDGERAVLKVSAVTYGCFRSNEYKVINNEIPISKYIFPQKGDLLFSRANTKELVGATALVDEDYPNLLLPDKIWKIVTSEKVSPVYLKFYLSAPGIRDLMSKSATGTSGSMYNISMEKLRKIPVLLPPLALQTAFADFMRRIDKSRFAIQASLDKTQQLFNSLMQEYFG